MELSHSPWCVPAVLAGHCLAQPDPQVDTITLDTRFQTIETSGRRLLDHAEDRCLVR